MGADSPEVYRPREKPRPGLHHPELDNLSLQSLSECPDTFLLRYCRPELFLHHHSTWQVRGLSTGARSRCNEPVGEGSIMNAIALFLMLVLNGNMTCGAEPPDQTVLGDQTVQVQVYDCYWSERESASHR